MRYDDAGGNGLVWNLGQCFGGKSDLGDGIWQGGLEWSRRHF